MHQQVMSADLFYVPDLWRAVHKLPHYQDWIMVKNLQQQQVKTAKPVSTDTTPRLPHEHDESSDSQSSPSREIMKQAAKDIESGQVDTDLRNGGGGVENVVDKNRRK